MFGLSFLYPLFLLGAAAAAVPIVLHLLRESPPKVRFSAVRFLNNTRITSGRRDLRNLVLLALRVAALVLLAFSFARPFAGAAADAAAVTIVAMDTSFSMSAPGQFDRAVRLARDAVNAAAPDAAVGVIAFSDEAEVVSPVSLNRPEALAAIDKLQPGAGGTQYAGALDRAADLIASRSGRVVVVTDLQAQGWQRSHQTAIPESIDVEVADAGAPAGNLAITDVRQEGSTAVAVIRNAGSAARSGQARLSIDERASGTAGFTVSPGVSTEVRFEAPLPSLLTGGALSVSIDDDEGFRADDVRYLALNRPAPLKVLAITSHRAQSEAFYLERALLAANDRRAFEWTQVSAGSVDGPEKLTPYAVVLLLSVQGLNRRGADAVRAYVQSGGGVFVVAGPDMLPDSVRRTVGEDLRLRLSALPQASLAFAPVDLRHPIFRAFGASVGDLGRVEITRAVRIAEDGGGHVLARFSNGLPALIELETSSGRILCFASDLNRIWNDFPLHPTFVPFVHEAVRYLGAARPEPDAYLVSDAPAGVPRRPGVHVRAGTGGPAGSRRVAVNVDTSESDLTRQDAEQFARSIPRSDAVRDAGDTQQYNEEENRQGLWRYGVMLMVAVLVVESVVGRSK